MSNNSRTFAVYTIIPSINGGKDFWQRIGVAFINRDGSMNVKLNALPVSGMLHIRENVKKEEAAA